MKLGEDLDKFIADAGGLSSFFNNKYQENFCMNSNVIYIIDDVQEPQFEQERLENENSNMYRIVGIIDGHYIVQTHNGLKKVKISSTDKKNVRDEIKIEKL